MRLQAAVLQAVCQQVYVRFPDLTGKQPKIQRQNLPASADGIDHDCVLHSQSDWNRSGSVQNQYLLTFRQQVLTANGHTMELCVRVVADESGKIIKLTTSR